MKTEQIEGEDFRVVPSSDLRQYLKPVLGVDYIDYFEQEICDLSQLNYESEVPVLKVSGDLIIEGDLYLCHMDNFIPKKMKWNIGYGKRYFDKSGNYVIPGDFVLNAYMNFADIVAVGGDLIVKGIVIDPCGDFGATLLVKGKITAEWLWCGGGVILADGAEIRESVFGEYNHGSLHLGHLKAKYLINHDHDTRIKESELLASFDTYNDLEAYNKKKDPAFLEAKKQAQAFFKKVGEKYMFNTLFKD
ncbi:MAG: hypothetical protein LBR25_09495 [Erysipelotrichaceae bacterium]|jgi:hypothetical protein|nr:hypothetical protein [Erysipelotrichaceae bacterium]